MIWAASAMVNRLLLSFDASDDPISHNRIAAPQSGQMPLWFLQSEYPHLAQTPTFRLAADGRMPVLLTIQIRMAAGPRNARRLRKVVLRSIALLMSQMPARCAPMAMKVAMRPAIKRAFDFCPRLFILPNRPVNRDQEYARFLWPHELVRTADPTCCVSRSTTLFEPRCPLTTDRRR